MIITLPWPHKDLSPNARKHWGAKATAKKKAREDAHLATLEAAGSAIGALRASLAGEGPIPVRIVFYPPDKRHRDDDNMVGSAKAARDGIADALQVNDRRFHPHYFFEAPAKPGRVEVWIGENFSPVAANDVLDESGPNERANAASGPDHKRKRGAL